MRVPLSWLAEYVDVAPGSSPEDVHAALVTVGLEEEEILRFDVTGPVVVGEVLTFEPEPQSNGKTIRWCSVRVAPEGETAADGGADVRGIVCGASNFAVGDLVVVTLPGSVLPGPFPIAARKTYGHVSDGMIASSKELGLGDESDGILRLNALGMTPAPGTDAIALLGLDDTAVDVNVTPDRGYALSIRGVAREYSHATGAAFRDPAGLVRPLDADGFSVTITDAAPLRGRAGATGFVTRVVRGIDATLPTPLWMVARLSLAGIRSLSLPIDITNYVMIELGQPLHGYDLATLDGGITVRRATAGETLTTLDGAERTLDAEDLLITDGSGPIGLAGVMGGARTEMTDATTDVLIEAATFDQVSIARTARRHKLSSEASRRFERGVDPLVAAPAAARAVQLLVELAGGTVDPLGSTLVASASADAIAFPDGFVAGLIGVDYSATQVRDALEMIGAVVTDVEGGVEALPPTWRPDLTDKWTLAEEVARIAGYDLIPSVLPVAPPQRGLTRDQTLRRGVQNALAASGLTEVLSYPFLGVAANQRWASADGSERPLMSLTNALDAREATMRTSLIPGLLAVAARNLGRGLTDLALYEQGLVFRPEPGIRYGVDTLPRAAVRPDAETLAALDASVPPQPRHVAMLALGHAEQKGVGTAARFAGLADVLEAVRTIGLASGVTIDVAQGTHHALHPGRTAELRVDGEIVGIAGELLPALAAEANLPRIVAVAELDLDRIFALGDAITVARPISGFPAATQDLSLVVPAETPAGDVLRAVQGGAGVLLEDIRLVDDYRGSGVAEGAKSLTFALRFRAPDRTLTAAEATESKLAGTAAAAAAFGATLRE